MIYRVTQEFGSNQGYWQEWKSEVAYVGDDKQEAFETYLRLAPDAGEGAPGDHGYLLRFESADPEECEHPDELEWQAIK